MGFCLGFSASWQMGQCRDGNLHIGGSHSLALAPFVSPNSWELKILAPFHGENTNVP